jgi:hypothetical protein
VDWFRQSMDSFRIVVTNPDSKKIHFVSWLTNLDSFRIVGHESFMFSKDSFCEFVSWIRFVDWFSKDSTCFYESYESLRILSTIAGNESLKIKIRESESLRILKIWIRESGFVTPNLRDSYHGFVSWICFWKIRFVDSFRTNQNLKLLDSFRFVRIRIRIPHP